ncbi:hypothetical protein GCM10023221_33510 [Luteimicrobium xylanilyticum]|uniref:Uncharacterized protein n=1 Tax=Luteimicrobium xylanilyticum TaxID=1133546 RepID=A0A5P9Q9M9_9MICO|nr:hypothetical protein [Luteimicrobium xylanilyticum]QFU98151.1 hypothetical protein KDY119_01660 [Luteimicrobium xylanilyticum]
MTQHGPATPVAPGPPDRGLGARLVLLARFVADGDPRALESGARRLGSSRRWLLPLAWAAGTLVLLLRGIRLLVLNWRLTVVQLVPAVWVWLVMWDLKHHTLRGAPFRDLHVQGVLTLTALCVAASVAALWCNTVFAYAIDAEPPRIAPAARRANKAIGRIVSTGVVVGLVLGAAAFVVPRAGSVLLYLVTLGVALAVMLGLFVAVPARIIGATRRRLPPREAVGSWAAAGALSAVAMTPGFVLDRVGLILLGVEGLHLLGLVMLSVGTALYAAGMSSVRAVKLTVKLGDRHGDDPAAEPRTTERPLG